MTNVTDLRIVKMFRQGISLDKIAKRIGRPNDIKRVKETLIRENIIEEENK